MVRVTIAAVAVIFGGFAAAGVLMPGEDEAPPPVAYHSLEREIARVTLEGERVADHGDLCLSAMRQGTPEAVERCRDFLDEARDWSLPLSAVGRRLADLDTRLSDDALIAVGASGDRAVQALAGLAAVTGRLGSQVAQVDAWMVNAAQAADLSGRRGLGRMTD